LIRDALDEADIAGEVEKVVANLEDVFVAATRLNGHDQGRADAA
jgi:ABC-2 type transport system ATP-binding protein